MEQRQELLGYINLRKEQGATTIEIANELKGEGWTEADIEGVMKKAFPKTQNDSEQFAHVVEQPKEHEPILSEKAEKTISTLLGSLIILLAATIAGSAIWWTAFSYEEPVVPDVRPIVKEQQENVGEVGLPNDYEIKDGGVYYEGRLIEGADAETFEYVGVNIYEGYYSKDVNAVYYLDKHIEEADPGTFEILGGVYARDKDYVYSYGNVFVGADPNTFEHDIGGMFAKDEKNVFYSEEFVIEGADPVTFEYVGGLVFAKDQNVAYAGKRVLEGVDPESFEYVGWSYVKDNENVYLGDRGVVKDADPETFVFLGGYYAKDKNTVFYEQEVIADADPASFVFVDETFAKDKDQVYWYGRENTRNPNPENCTVDNLEGCEG